MPATTKVGTSVLPLSARKPRRDLLELPLIAIRITERSVGLIRATFRIPTWSAPSSQVEQLTDLDSTVNEIGARRLDVADGEQ
jgi:hypothetical protein